MSKIISNPVRVKNFKAASDVKNHYLFDFDVELVPDPDTEQGTICIKSDIHYLRAACLYAAPDEEDFATEEAYFNALDDYLYEHGDVDIHLMLQDLAETLAEPMTILLLEDGYDGWAEAWLLNPEPRKVEQLVLSA